MRYLSKLSIIGMAILLQACAGMVGSGDEQPQALNAPGSEVSGGGIGGFTAGSLQEFDEGVGGTVYFGLNEYNLTAEAEQILRAQAQWLNRYNPSKIVIEGHADERGTREYNLALSVRRANSVRDFLVAEGVAADIIETVGYGKERPVSVCAEERCYAQNRRSASVIEGL